MCLTFIRSFRKRGTGTVLMSALSSPYFPGLHRLDGAGAAPFGVEFGFATGQATEQGGHLFAQGRRPLDLGEQDLGGDIMFCLAFGAGDSQGGVLPVRATERTRECLPFFKVLVNPTVEDLAFPD